MTSSDRRYSVIVFDLGNVLSPFDYHPALDAVEHIERGLGGKLREFFTANYEYHRAFERGDVTSDEFVARMLSVLDHKVTAEQFCRMYSEIFTLNKALIALLPQLRKQYTLVLLSNTNPIHLRYGYGGFDFLKQFDKLVLSFEVNAVKPESKIYEAVEAFTKAPPAEHIFVDDIAEYTETARRMGWDAVQYVGFRNLVAEFTKRGIL